LYVENTVNLKFPGKTAGLLLCVAAALMFSGCNIFGVLFSPSGWEQQVPPAYDLKEHKGEKIYVSVRAISSSGSDIDLPAILSDSIAKELRRKVQLPEEAVIEESTAAVGTDLIGRAYENVETRALQAGAALLLYVEIREYDLFSIHTKDYYTGQLLTRSMLMDPQTKEVLWPKEPGGRRIEAVVELETEGRRPALNRLTAATAHCIVREFTATPKTGYRCADERRSVDDLMKELE
jgi:hypothetical protein